MCNPSSNLKKISKTSKLKLYINLLLCTLVISILWNLSANNKVKAEVLDSDIVTFEDANLEAVVRNKLSKPSEDITVGDMKGITGRFDAIGRNINSLKGLEYAINIADLNLNNNKINDLTPLITMTNLYGLDLSDNQIIDISPLMNLTNLVRLDLGGNEISDISPLINMTKLQHLYLYSNKISDIESLKTMTDLEWLFIIDNQISDIEPLRSMKNLKYLNLTANQVNDISPLVNMTNLYWLDLSINKISVLSESMNTMNLFYLNLSYNQVMDIEPLMNITTLTMLILRNNNIESVPVNIGNLTNLEYLDMRNNKLYEQLPESLNLLVNLLYWDGDTNPFTSCYTSFAGNQLTGTIPANLKEKINNQEAFQNNLFEGEPSQKQLSLKQPSTELNLSIGEIPSQSLLQSLVELDDGTNKTAPLYELQLAPIDNSFIEPNTNKTLKSGTTTAYIKLKGVSDTNTYAKTLVPITINISNSLGANKEINVAFSLQESLEITIDNNIVNFGKVSSNGGEKQNTNIKITSSLPYSVSFIGLNNFIGTNDNSHVIPIDKLSLKIDTLDSKALSLSKINYISNATSGIDKNHTLEFIMSNTLGYFSDTYSTELELIVETL